MSADATARAEAERRWPSPNSGLYEGLIEGFVLGARWSAEALEWHMQQEASLRDDIANLEKERDIIAAKAWDEGNAAGWDDGADANTAGLDSPTVNPYRWGPELTARPEQ